MARLRVLGENPPPPRGNGENQLRELRDYITRLKDELEFLLTHLGEDNLDGDLTEYLRRIQDQSGEIEDINTALAGKQDTLTFDNVPTSGSDNPVKSGGVYSALSGKQNTLTFDNSPTNGSSNPVKSGGVYTALSGKQNTLTFDNAPTSGSNNPVKSGGIYTALSGKQSTLTFDNAPASGSANPVKSSGIYNALQRKSNPNLLTNAYFIGGGSQLGEGSFPINQRGQTSYTAAGYGIDRWKCERATHTLTLQSDYIHWERITAGYNPKFYQPVKVRPGEVYTFSILYRTTFRKLREAFAGTYMPEASDWTLYTKTATATVAAQNAGVQDSSNGNNLDDTGKYVEIKAMKLELGSEQTLAHLENGAWELNEIPDYGRELYECQRYLKQVVNWSNIYAARSDTTNLYFFIPGATMARVPDTLTSKQVYFYAGPNYYTITDNIAFTSHYGGIRATMPKGSIPNNLGGTLAFASAVFISAE